MGRIKPVMLCTPQHMVVSRSLYTNGQALTFSYFGSLAVVAYRKDMIYLLK